MVGILCANCTATSYPSVFIAFVELFFPLLKSEGGKGASTSFGPSTFGNMYTVVSIYEYKHDF